MRKALGWLMLAIGVSGVLLSLVGIISGRRLIDSIGNSLQANLTLTIESLDTFGETLQLTKATVAQLDTGLATAEEATGNISAALAETGPMLVEGSQIVTEDVPHSIETFQASMPALIEASGAIDRTLRTLNAFGVNRTILGIPLSFDLGVDYDPEVPFDQSVRDLGDSLEGMPEQLRGLESLIEMTNDNLMVASQDLASLQTNLEGVNTTLDEVSPLIDEYIAIVTDIGDNMRQLRAMMNRQVAQAQWILTTLMIWFALLQSAPLYLGWELISGRRGAVHMHVSTAPDTVVKTQSVVLHQERAVEDGDDA